MKIGFATRYHGHEATYAALRMADWAAFRGAETTFYAYPCGSRSISPKHESQLFTTPTLFSDWAKSLDLVVWTHVPHVDHVLWLKARNIRSLVFLLGAETDAADIDALRAMDGVICPLFVTALYAETKLRVPQNKLHIVPWESGLPLLTRRSTDPESLRILLPLYDGMCNRISATSIDVFGRALARNETVRGTVLFNTSTLAGHARRRLHKLASYFGDRLILVPGLPDYQRPAIIAQHDLMVWPSELESTCMAGIQAIACGVPVLGFSWPITAEVFNCTNSIMVGDSWRTDRYGWPSANGDHDKYEKVLDWLLKNPDRVFSLQTSLLTGREERRTLFDETLSNTLGIP